MNRNRLSIARMTNKPVLVRCSMLLLPGIGLSFSWQLPTLLAPKRERAAAMPSTKAHAPGEGLRAGETAGLGAGDAAGFAWGDAGAAAAGLGEGAPAATGLLAGFGAAGAVVGAEGGAGWGAGEHA